MSKNKTYENFGDAIDGLRTKAGLSYDRLSLEVDIAQSYLYHIINRRKPYSTKHGKVSLGESRRCC